MTAADREHLERAAGDPRRPSGWVTVRQAALREVLAEASAAAPHAAAARAPVDALPGLPLPAIHLLHALQEECAAARGRWHLARLYRGDPTTEASPLVADAHAKYLSAWLTYVTALRAANAARRGRAEDTR